MTNSSDPIIHRQRETLFIEHVERLLNDDRLRIDTTSGRRPVLSLRRNVQKQDHEVELKRLMAELDRPDRDLQGRMPVGQELLVALYATRWFIFKTLIGRMKVVCVSPQRELLEGQPIRPLTPHDVKT
ncbi:MAG: hypothetical protein ACM359_22965, partial [Bacillota bacterium]